jgi:predicted site-specific integrase-resolvase
MTLNKFAERCGVHYRTAYSWWKKDMLKAFQISTGPIIVDIRDTDPLQDAFKEGETADKYIPENKREKGDNAG